MEGSGAITASVQSDGNLSPGTGSSVVLSGFQHADGLDTDGDGICDGNATIGGICKRGPEGGDNCRLVFNAGQANSDSLSAGDAVEFAAPASRSSTLIEPGSSRLPGPRSSCEVRHTALSQRVYNGAAMNRSPCASISAAQALPAAEPAAGPDGPVEPRASRALEERIRA